VGEYPLRAFERSNCAFSRSAFCLASLRRTNSLQACNLDEDESPGSMDDALYIALFSWAIRESS
jgi:hypothetical protein